MRLHFKSDTGKIINISTSPENWNDDATEYETIAISEKDYNKVLRILDFNMIPYSHDLETTEAQHEKEIKRATELQAICERICAGETLQAPRATDKNGKSYPRSTKLQRDIVSITMLVYPEKNNSEIAATTGASLNTVRSCRGNTAEYETLLGWIIEDHRKGGLSWF